MSLPLSRVPCHNPSEAQETTYNAGDPGSIPGSGRSPGEGNGNPPLYSCLGNPMDRGAWWATVHGVTRVGHNLVTNHLGMMEVFSTCEFIHESMLEHVQVKFLKCCCCSVTQSCPTLCHPMDCSMPGFPVHHHLPQLAQTHVHQVGDAIHPSQPLSSLSLPAFKLPQHQSLFQEV